MGELQFFINKYFDKLDNSHLEAIIFNLIGVKSFFLFEPTKEAFLKTVNDCWNVRIIKLIYRYF